MNTSNTTARATVTFHTSPELKNRLDQLAAATHRSKSYLTNKAVERYLAEEEDFINSVQEGIKDVDSGRTHTLSAVNSALKKSINESAK